MGYNVYIEWEIRNAEMITNTDRIVTMMLADVAISDIAVRLAITETEVVEVIREVLKDLILGE